MIDPCFFHKDAANPLGSLLMLPWTLRQLNHQPASQLIQPPRQQASKI